MRQASCAMAHPIPVLRSTDEIARWRAAHAGNAFVPTMGALHEGHAALVRQAAAIARDRNLPGVSVSIFVNPTQFDDPRDYERYPKTLDADVALCAAAGATAVIAPEVAAVYPTPESRRKPDEHELPRVATAPHLEDAHRPGHFAGVVLVVSRLFEMVAPSVSVFGEKDWQQLQVVRAMAEAQGGVIEIVPGETIREADGLAMSSRNRFLAPPERARARAISQSLAAAGACADADEAERIMDRMLREAGIVPDYAVIRDAQSLERTRPALARDAAPAQWRAIITGRLGSVRLLDNAPWPTQPRT